MKEQKSTEMTSSYISIGPITLLTIHINSKITENPPSNMSSNNRIEGNTATHSHGKTTSDHRHTTRTTARNSNHIDLPHAPETASSTSSKPPQDEAALREATNSQPSDNSNPRWKALTNNAVYVALHAVYVPFTYHCGLFIPTSKERHQGVGWSINNDEGNWKQKLLSFDEVFARPTLLLLHRVGQIHEGREADCERKLHTLHADGTCSDNRVATVPGSSSRLMYGTAAPDAHGHAEEDMDSMARVKQAMRTLSDDRLITVCEDRAAALEDHISHLVEQIWDLVICDKKLGLVT